MYAKGWSFARIPLVASALMRVSVLKAPPKLIVPLLLIISVNSNIAGDAGFLIMPMIGAMIFGAMGKNPIAGMALCYAGVAGGFSANFMVGSMPFSSGIPAPPPSSLIPATTPTSCATGTLWPPPPSFWPLWAPW